MNLKIIFTSLILIVSLAFTSAPQALAVKYVRSYYKPSSFKYVNSYYRTNSNSYKYDNYSAKYNYNPYTGKKGYGRWY